MKRKTFKIKFYDLIKKAFNKEVEDLDINNPIYNEVIHFIKETVEEIIKNEIVFYANRPNDISNNTREGDCFEKVLVNKLNEKFEKRNLNLKAKWLKKPRISKHRNT